MNLEQCKQYVREHLGEIMDACDEGDKDAQVILNMIDEIDMYGISANRLIFYTTHTQRFVLSRVQVVHDENHTVEGVSGIWHITIKQHPDTKCSATIARQKGKKRWSELDAGSGHGDIQEAIEAAKTVVQERYSK